MINPRQNLPGFRRGCAVFALCIPSFICRAEPAGLPALIQESCLDCHDDSTRNGKLSLESLDPSVSDANAATWLRCLEQVERGFMPPADKPQPTAEEREAAILDLESRLVQHHSKKPRQDHQTILRRLNRDEYRNTIRDLLQLELGSDPTAAFPGDQRSHGFVSNGGTLVTSSFLLRQYLEVAEDIVDRAVQFGPKPESRHWDMRPPFDRTTGAEQQQAIGYYKKTKQQQTYQDLCQRIGAGGAPYAMYHPLDDMSDSGAPVSGWYRVRIQAEAKFRHALVEKEFKRWRSLWDASEPIRLSLFTATLQGIGPANKEARTFAATHEQAGQRHIATWDLPDDERVWLECRVWLDQGQFPRLGFPNGPTNSNYRMNDYFNEHAKATLDAAGLAQFEERKKLYGGWIGFHFGESPRIRLHAVEVDGPLNEVWPPASHRVIFGDQAYQSKSANGVLQHFASLAWRRPVQDNEVAPIVDLVQAAEAKGMNPQAAIREGLKAILCSPGFIYREEKDDSLNGHEIASRLSYFLWASMPDERLLKRAVAGELQDAPTIRAEAQRLLADPRSDAFVDLFLDGWLRLSKLGSMAPDPHRFSIYYDDRLEPAMRQETRIYFRHLLETNGSVARFLDSDYTFANKELAGLYGINPDAFAAQSTTGGAGLAPRYFKQDGVGDSPSTRFARVSLTDRRRGGLLGQASLLTLTANGVDTSPVIRGAWLLENILGTPPTPPPPGVPALEPDIRGATTIREQLQKHRENATCRSCHARIDPPGFALESFNPIGGWRGHYRIGDQNIPIDTTGNFEGQEFKDIIEFKAALMKREPAFARCLVEKLLMHALGRELEITDRPHIRHILDNAAKNGYRLRDLVLLCVENEVFRRK